MSLQLIRPFLPILAPTLPVGKEWLCELKYDGFRGVLYLDGAEAFFRSKTGNRMRRFADLAEAVQRELQVENAIFDSEIVALDDTGRPQFMRRSAARGSSASGPPSTFSGSTTRISATYRSRSGMRN